MSASVRRLSAALLCCANLAIALPHAQAQGVAQAPPLASSATAEVDGSRGAGALKPAAAPPLVEDDFSLGTSRRRIRLGLDPVDSLLQFEYWTTAVYYGLSTGQALFFDAAFLRPCVGIPLMAVPLAGALTGAYYLMHRNPQLHAGVFAALDLGIWAGALNGALIGHLASEGTSNKTRWRAGHGAAWGLGTLAGAGGAMLAHRLGATKGDIGLLGTTTFWGGVTGLLLNLTVYGDFDAKRHNHNTSKLSNWAVLAGSLTGSAIGLGLVAKLDVSRTRAIFLDLGGLTGASVGIALSQIATQTRDSVQAFGAFMLGGELLGLATAALLTHRLDVKLPSKAEQVRLAPTVLPVQNRSSDQPSMVPGVALSAMF